jgi:hypothetical protein
LPPAAIRRLQSARRHPNEVVQAQFLKRLRAEKIELESRQRFGKQCVNLSPEFGRRRAELGFQLPQSRPPFAPLDAAFLGGLQERFEASVLDASIVT